MLALEVLELEAKSLAIRIDLQSSQHGHLDKTVSQAALALHPAQAEHLAAQMIFLRKDQLRCFRSARVELD